MKRSIFISYARRTSLKYAEALRRMLGEAEAFLDTSDLEVGERIPESLLDALLESRVVVVFADELYFRRWYCLWELRVALEPYLKLHGRASEAERNDALRSLVIVWPADGQQPEEGERLPPPLRSPNWPRADELPKLVALVRQRLEAEPRTLGARLDAAGGSEPWEARRRRLLEESEALPPANLAKFKGPLYPMQQRPSIGSAFKGRAHDLWRLDFMLSTGVRGAAPPVVVLQGVAGLGKTRLALEYLHRLGSKHFPGGIFWVDAEAGEERREEQFHGILQAIWPDVPNLMEFKELKRKAEVELAKALREVAAKMPVLYVVDNVPETDGKASQPLKTWCPAEGQVSLLVTSRARQTLGPDRVHALPVDTLESGAAVALLTHELPGVSHEDVTWKKIAELVGYLPLALELLNRAIQVGGTTKDELLNRLKQGVARELDHQMEALRPHVSSGALRGVTEAFRISYERLSEPARRTAHLLAHMAPDPIPLAVLTSLGGEAASSTVRTYLQARHYVTHVTDKNDVNYFGVMHRLLADWLREQSESPFQELDVLCEVLVKILTPSFCSNPRNWSLASVYLPHAEKVFRGLCNRREKNKSQALSEANLGCSISILLYTSGSPQSASQFQREALARLPQAMDADILRCHVKISRLLALSLYEIRQYQEARVIQEQMLEVCQLQLGLKDKETLRVKSDFAVTLRRLGNSKQAWSLQKEVLEVCKRNYDPEDPVTLDAMSQLALTTRALGKLEQACEQQRDLLSFCEQNFSLEEPIRITAMYDLAITLHELNKLSEACSLLKQVQEAFERTHGRQHRRTELVQKRLDYIRQRMGMAAPSDTAHEKGLETRRHVLGLDWNTLTAMHEEELETRRYTLGPEYWDALTAIVKHEEELETHRHALNPAAPATSSAAVHPVLTVRNRVVLEQVPSPQKNEQAPRKSQRTLDPKHLSTLNAMIDSASRLWESGKLSEARSLQEQVLRDFQHNLDPDDPRTLEAKADLALILRDLGEMKDALSLQEDVLKAYEHKLGLEHRDTLEAMGSLAVTLRSLGNLKNARSLQEKVLNAYKDKFGMEDLLTLTATDYFTATLRDLGELSLARVLGENVLKVRRHNRGPKHPETLVAMANLARTLRILGEWEHALAYEQEVMKEREDILGRQHPDTLAAKANLAETLRDIGRLDQARVFENQVLEARRVIPQHPDTLTAMANLASTLRTLGRGKEAYSLEQEVLKHRQHIFGPDHPDTLAAMTNLALTYRVLGQLEQAYSWQQEVRKVSEGVLGLEHPLTLTAMGNLASTLRALGQLEQARSLEEQVLEIRKRIFDPKHPDLLTAMGNLASTLQALGQLEQARFRQQYVLETCQNTVGPRHPRTLTAMFGFASILKDLGELEQARSYAEQALKTMRDILGDTHPETQSLATFVASLQPTSLWHWMSRAFGR